MICTGWMKAFKYDPIAMLKCLGVMDNETEANNALDVIFEAAREEESELLEDLSDPEIRAFKSGIEKASIPIKSPDDDIQVEQLLFLRARCANIEKSTDLTSTQKETLTAKFLPEIPLLCETFEKHSTKLMDAINDEEEESRDVESFLCLQLLQLAQIAGLKEEGSRRHFAFVMKRMLSSIDTPDELVEGCINALKMAYDREEDLLDVVCEILADIDGASREDSNDDDHDDGDNNVDQGDLKTIRLVRSLGILTVILENASSQLSSNACVSDFAEKIIPACTHSDPMVREVGVSCFGKLGLFTDAHALLSEFKPLMLSVAAREQERMEIRAQALLALSDWSMLHSDVMTPCQVEEENVAFTDILLKMMDDSRTAAVSIAAEVATKLLFTGRTCDSTWLARLLAIFFDTRMMEVLDDDDIENVQELGSPVRLQQLLSLFFPAYSIKSEMGRSALLGSIQPLLEHIYVHQVQASSKGKKGKGQRKKITWPVVKMIQYVCSTVDTGKPSSEKNNVTETIDEKTQAGEESQSIARTEVPQSSSTSLMAGIQVAAFLAAHFDCINITTQRALCKLLGVSIIEEEAEELKELQTMKKYLEEIGMQIDDANCLNSLAPLNELLVDIEVDDNSDNEEEQDSILQDVNSSREQREGGDGESSVEAPSDEDSDSDSDLFGDNKSTDGDKRLSSELMAALGDMKLGAEEDDDDESGVKDSGGKENSKKLNGRKSSTGSTTSRNSTGSRKRLGAVN